MAEGCRIPPLADDGTAPRLQRMRLQASSGLWVVLVACGGGGDSPPVDSPPPDDVTPTRTIEIEVGAATGAAYAFQDGDTGAWQLAPAASAGTITLTIASERYAVARLCANSRLARVFYRAATETAVALPCFVPGPPLAGKIAGTITSNPEDTHQLLHGPGIAFEFSTDPSFAYELDTEGTSDFVAVREPASGDAIDVFHVERDLLVSGTVTRDLDFATLEAPLTVAQPVPDEDAASAYTGFIPNADVFQFSTDFVKPFVHTVLPVAARRVTDRYDVGVSVNLAEDSTVEFDAIQAVPTAVTAPTANLLDPLDVTTGEVLTIGWNRVAGTTLRFGTISDAEGFAFTDFTAAWEDTFTNGMSFGVPDLSGVAGWPARGGLRAPADSVSVTAVVESGAFPEDGYEASTFRRSFTAGSPVAARARRELDRARWMERVRDSRRRRGQS